MNFEEFTKKNEGLKNVFNQVREYRRNKLYEYYENIFDKEDMQLQTTMLNAMIMTHATLDLAVCLQQIPEEFHEPFFHQLKESIIEVAKEKQKMELDDQLIDVVKTLMKKEG